MRVNKISVVLALLTFLFGLGLWSLFGVDENQTSTCYGNSGNGYLRQGVPLALGGDNFKSYTLLGNLLRRTFVHHKVKHVVETSFAQINKSHPQYRYLYAESGFPQGGRFRPHRTHRNGTSVDFLVPVRDEQNRVSSLPRYPWNQFGYAIDFDARGYYRDLHIDFEALALHLKILHQTAREEGSDIWRVIFDPRLQPRLFATSHGAYLQQHLQFNRRAAWVRHDEHYHVDFTVQCHPL